MKTALASVVSDDFVPGFLGMYHSLRKHNPSWDYPFHIFHHRERAPLSSENRKRILAICPAAVFSEVNESDYAGIFDFALNVIGTPPRLMAAFFILEALRMSEFDRVVSLDSDLLITGSLRLLEHCGDGFAAVRARHHRTDAPVAYVNTGVLSIGRQHLDKRILDSFLHAMRTRPLRPETGKADQAIINLYFQNHDICYLPSTFNMTKRSFLAKTGGGPRTPTETIRNDLRELDVRVLHYVADKPWKPKTREGEDDYAALERLWFEEVGEPAGLSLEDHSVFSVFRGNALPS